MANEWSEHYKKEAKLLIKKVCEKFKISDKDFTIWQKARGISGKD